jgi:mRNA interferase RelE/StbE
MQVEFKERFVKDLSKANFTTRNKVKSLIEQIELTESLNAIANVKKLKGTVLHYYRIRVGDYRIGIKLENDNVIFVRFLYRKEMYRYFP